MKVEETRWGVKRWGVIVKGSEKRCLVKPGCSDTVNTAGS